MAPLSQAIPFLNVATSMTTLLLAVAVIALAAWWRWFGPYAVDALDRLADPQMPGSSTGAWTAWPSVGFGDGDRHEERRSHTCPMAISVWIDVQMSNAKSCDGGDQRRGAHSSLPQSMHRQTFGRLRPADTAAGRHEHHTGFGRAMAFVTRGRSRCLPHR